MINNLPYCASVGTLQNIFEKIKMAAVPERFTQDFLATKLGMKGGTARACIPFLKKMGFVASDGTPTELYKEFRNPQKSAIAIGIAFRKLYSRLYEMNEYFHELDDKELVGLIVQCTGDEKNSYGTKSTVWTINALKKIAEFDSQISDAEEIKEAIPSQMNIPVNLPSQHISQSGNKGINLSYTINLNLPATKDIEIFNAIFKSLKEHLLDN